MGKVPGSYAVYTKVVDPIGKTIGYSKQVYDRYGNLLSDKNKLKDPSTNDGGTATKADKANSSSASGEHDVDPSGNQPSSNDKSENE